MVKVTTQQENHETPSNTPISHIPISLAWRILCTVSPDRAYSGKWLEWYHQTSETITGRSTHGYQLIDFLSRSVEFPDAPILELAAGTGHITSILSEKLPERQIFAVEISDFAVQELGKKQLKNVHTTRTDFNRLPLLNESIGLTICVGGYRHVQDPSIFWREVERTSQLNGYFVISQFHPPSPLDHIHTFDTNPKLEDVLRNANGSGFELVKIEAIKSDAPKFRIDIPFLKGYYEVLLFQKKSGYNDP